MEALNILIISVAKFPIDYEGIANSIITSALGNTLKRGVILGIQTVRGLLLNLKHF